MRVGIMIQILRRVQKVSKSIAVPYPSQKSETVEDNQALPFCATVQKTKKKGSTIQINPFYELFEGVMSSYPLLPPKFCAGRQSTNAS